jgi:tetratricopeptide (TPR) repeat protein
VYEAMRAILQGRLAEAEQLVLQVLSQGQQVHGNLAMQVYGAQMLALRWLQGRLPEVEGAFRALAAQYPGLAALAVPLAFIECELGRNEQTRATFAAFAAGGFETLPMDSTWLMSMSLLANICTQLDDREQAAVLYDRMAPFSGRVVLLGDALVSNGSCARYVGKLATTLGRWDDAERHFDAAEHANETIGAHPFAALGKYDRAMMLLARGRDDDRARAASLLENAAASAREIGMPALIKQCEELMAKVT